MVEKCQTSNTSKGTIHLILKGHIFYLSGYSYASEGCRPDGTTDTVDPEALWRTPKHDAALVLVVLVRIFTPLAGFVATSHTDDSDDTDRLIEFLSADDRRIRTHFSGPHNPL